MKKQQILSKNRILFGTLLAVPMSFLILYVGLVIATGSLIGFNTLSEHSTDLCIDAELSDQVLAWYQEMSDDLDEELSYEVLDDTLRTTFQTAGRSPRTIFLPEMVDLSFEYEPKKQAQWFEPRSEVIIRPAHAQRVWKRLQQHARFSWPVSPDTFWVSSYYGPRTLKGQRGFHNGVDLAARTGTPVKAAGSGKVLEARYASGYGNYIVIEHKDQYKTRYAHLQRILVKAGQRVRSGQLIGKVGATGKVTKSKWGTSASHLHFEVYRNGERINPFCVLV